MTVAVVLADDHQIFRQGLRAILQTVPDVCLVGEAADGPEAVRLAEQLRPNVLVLDLMLPGMNGFEVARRVRRRVPATHIVVLSIHSDVAYVLEALRAGASGYVVKEASFEELLRAIREAAAGRRYLSPPLSETALGEHARRASGPVPDPYETLTAREREVLQLTAEGLTGAAIARRLHISPRTVESHRANIIRKLGVKNQKELIRYAVQRGLAPAPREEEE